MNVVFVHGWNVRNTDTYGGLPRFLERQRAGGGSAFRISHLYLGKYISFDDAVTIDDIAHAFEQALNDTLDKRVSFARMKFFANGVQPDVRAESSPITSPISLGDSSRLL